MNSSNKRFSVVIPTHNRINLLPRAIQSVLKQTFDDFELIIVDDASTDDTQAVVEAFRDSKIIYLRQSKNCGAAAARNRGIREARGEFVSFLDDDDEYLPSFLVDTYTAFQNAPPNVGFSWAGTQLIQDTGEGSSIVSKSIWQPQFESRRAAYLAFLSSRKIGTNAGVTVRRDYFDKIGLFDESLKKAEDTDFLIRIAQVYDFVVVPAVLVKVHWHGGPRLTVYDRAMAEAYEKIIHKNSDTLASHPKLRAGLYYKTGWLHYHSGNRARGRHLLLQALRKYPLHMKSWLGLFIFEFFGHKGKRIHQQISVWKDGQNRDFSS